MKIDITQEPPTDIFRNMGKYKLAVVVCLLLSACGLSMAAYAILSDTSHFDQLEMVSFILFVGPLFVFSYFGEKLQALRRLTSDQEKELTEMGQQHTEIKTYCAQVAMNGRLPVNAEYEACQAWAENESTNDELRQ